MRIIKSSEGGMIIHGASNINFAPSCIIRPHDGEASIEALPPNPRKFNVDSIMILVAIPVVIRGNRDGTRAGMI